MLRSKIFTAASSGHVFVRGYIYQCVKQQGINEACLQIRSIISLSFAFVTVKRESLISGEIPFYIHTFSTEEDCHRFNTEQMC